MGNNTITPDYTPAELQNIGIRQHSFGATYTYSIRPNLLLTVSGGFIKSRYELAVPGWTGKQNLADAAGIQGLQTQGREAWIGLPTVAITGYTGYGVTNGAPGAFPMSVRNGKASANWIHGAHSFAFGYELDDRSSYGQHSSCCGRGNFTFNGQYTTNGFADYLLGLVQSSLRNYPLNLFGEEHAPYSGAFVQDYWKITPNLTLTLGVRYEYWHAHELYKGAGSTFDPQTGKIVAGVNSSGKVDLGAQAVAPALAAATQGLWVPATQVHYPSGLFYPNGNWAPRVGITWRPLPNADLVFRAGYGIYYSSFRGNIAGSAVVGPPYWTREQLTFSASTLQPWETAWPINPQAFVFPSVNAPAVDIKAVRTREWNIAVQKSLPLKSALTLAYLGSKMDRGTAWRDFNAVPPGSYADLQAARPYAAFSSLTILGNPAQSWYDAFQLKWERRFMNGLSFMTSYAFGKNLVNNTNLGNDSYTYTIFAPPGWYKGRSIYDSTHILSVNAVYELPFGRHGKHVIGNNHVIDGVLGGWELTGIYGFISGTPLSISVPGATLGNGMNARANLIGDPGLSNQTSLQWFKTTAFAAPPLYQWGNSGVGIIDAPGTHSFDLALMKKFYISEEKFLQLRGEAYNSTNHVNLSAPGTTFGTADFGRISSAGAARTVQVGLKFIF